MGLNVELLAESFKAVRPQKEVFARTFYNNLFFAYPQTARLFRETDMKRQQTALVGAIALVISLLEQAEDEQFVAVIQNLGQRHQVYGVKWEHYWMVGNVLLRTLADFSGDRWTAELNDAWADAYQAIVKLMCPVPARLNTIVREQKEMREDPVTEDIVVGAVV